MAMTNKHEELTDQAIEANIEHYRNLYAKSTEEAREHNKQIWYWIWVRNTRTIVDKTT